MENQKVYNLIDECVREMLKIDEIYFGAQRIEMHEKEEKFYKGQFKRLDISPGIVSKIYSSRQDSEKINEIKKSLDSLILK